MPGSQPTPPMSSHKAIWSSIAALITSIVLAFLGVLPTSDTLLANDLQQLIENIAALAIMSAIPGIVAYRKRNYRK